MAAEGKLQMAVQEDKLSNIERCWNADPKGKRLVVRI